MFKFFVFFQHFHLFFYAEIDAFLRCYVTSKKRLTWLVFHIMLYLPVELDFMYSNCVCIWLRLSSTYRDSWIFHRGCYQETINPVQSKVWKYEVNSWSKIQGSQINMLYLFCCLFHIFAKWNANLNDTPLNVAVTWRRLAKWCGLQSREQNEAKYRSKYLQRKRLLKKQMATASKPHIHAWFMHM